MLRSVPALKHHLRSKLTYCAVDMDRITNMCRLIATIFLSNIAPYPTIAHPRPLRSQKMFYFTKVA